MRGKSDRERQKGVSLLEIMIVVMIVGILAALAINNFRQTADKYRVESETKEMFADLMDARARALQKNRVSFVRLLPNGYETYEDISPAPDGNGSLEIGADKDRLVVKETLSPKHTFETADLAAVLVPGSGAETFLFDRSGIASVTGAGYIRIVSESGVRPDYDCIVIGPTRVKMGRFNGGTCEEK